MPINRTSVSSTSAQNVTNSVIEIRSERPNITSELDPPETPGRLIGYYNDASGFVELYVVSSDGLYLMRV